MSENKGISVVIPNFNGVTLLPLTLPPLFEALNNTKLPFEIIISDDASTDNSVAFLKTNYNSILIIENKINQGFSKTINQGIFAAKYSFLLLLNSDVKLSPKYFENLLKYFELPDTFGVMGRIVGWDDDQIQDGGKYPSFHGVKIKTSGNYIPIETENNHLNFSMYLSGANAFVSKEKIQQLKGFDEIFSPFYIEDFELSIRAWRLGWKCYYEHSAICKHKVSVTINNKNSKNYIRTIYNRNKMLLHAIHLPKTKLYIWYIQLFFEGIIQLVLGKWWFFNAIKQFLNSRKALKQSKENLYNLSKMHNGLISTKTIANCIKQNLANIKIKRF